MSLLNQLRDLPQQVIDRLKELAPVACEYEQLRKLAERLGLTCAPDADAEADGAHTRTSARGETRARAPQRSGRAATQTAGAAGAPARTHAARSPAASRGARASSRQRAARSTKAAGAGGAGAPARKRAGAASSGERSASRRAGAARPGQRHDEVLRLVAEQPGITVRELAERLGVEAAGLARVVKRLTEDGRVRKDGPSLHLVEPGGAAAALADVERQQADQLAGELAQLRRRADEERDGAAAFTLWLRLRDVDREQAERYLRLADELDHVAAAHQLGLLLWRERDERGRAVELLDKAARGGDRDAMRDLGLLLGEQGDLGGAIHWLRQAVERDADGAAAALADVERQNAGEGG